MIIHGINIKPTQDNIKTVEILAGNVPNSNEDNKDDKMYQSPNTMLYEAKNIRHKS